MEGEGTVEFALMRDFGVVPFKVTLGLGEVLLWMEFDPEPAADISPGIQNDQ